MRKIITLFAGLVLAISSFSQVVADFRYLDDDRLYLIMQNQSQYSFTAIGAVYRNGNCYNSETLNFYPGAAFYLGPQTAWHWNWRKGDRYVITYPNGQSAVWTCPIDDSGTSSVSFGASGWNGEGNPPNANGDGYIPSSKKVKFGSHTYIVYNKGNGQYVYDRKKGWCKIN